MCCNKSQEMCLLLGCMPGVDGVLHSSSVQCYTVIRFKSWLMFGLLRIHKAILLIEKAS